MRKNEIDIEQAHTNGRCKRTSSAAIESEIVSAAETLFSREGIDGLTVRAVAAEAGVAPMGVYSRLGGKIGLINALIIKGFDQLRMTIENCTEQDPIARLHSCALRYRQFAIENPHFYALMFDATTAREPVSGNVGAHTRAVFLALLRSVELAAAGGHVQVPDAAEAAQQFWSALHGAVALELQGLINTSDPAATYKALTITLISGMAPR